jgi:hypothetical protein
MKGKLDQELITIVKASRIFRSEDIGSRTDLQHYYIIILKYNLKHGISTFKLEELLVYNVFCCVCRFSHSGWPHEDQVRPGVKYDSDNLQNIHICRYRIHNRTSTLLYYILQIQILNMKFILLY